MQVSKWGNSYFAYFWNDLAADKNRSVYSSTARSPNKDSDVGWPVRLV